MHKLFFAPLVLALLTLVAVDVAALDNSTSDRSYTVSKINEKLFLLTGSLGHGPNVGLSISESRALIIDGPRRAVGQLDLMRKIREITDLPIEYAIVPDGDYVLRDRSLFFDQLGAKVIAQENSVFGYTPSHIRFKHQLSLAVTNETIDLYHITVNANDDIIVHFPVSNTIFVGNLYYATGLPAFFVGGVEGMQSAVELLQNLGDEHTIIVPRYGPPTTIAKVQQYLTDSRKLVDQVHRLHSTMVPNAKIVANSRFLEAVARLTGESRPSAQRLSRIVERIISTEFVKSQFAAEESFDLHLGKYRSEDDGVIELVKVNGSLFARQEGAFMVELIPISETSFHIRGGLGDRLEISRRSQTFEVSGLELFLYGQTVKAQRIN